MEGESLAGNALLWANPERRNFASPVCGKNYQLFRNRSHSENTRRAATLWTSKACGTRPALAAEPDLLLLDEPMAGMNLEEKQDMCRFVLDINEQYGTTIVLIEHDMGVVMDLSERLVVLDYGRKIADGTPEEVRSNQTVIDAYLGVTK